MAEVNIFSKDVFQLHREVKILVLSVFLWEIGLTLYDAILPVHLRDLGADVKQIGIIFSIGFFVTGIVSLPGGYLAERYERRNVLLVFWILGAPAALIYLVANSWLAAVPGVILYYLSFMAFPAINSYITLAAHPGRLAAVFGLLYATFPLAQLIGPVLGGLLAERQGFPIVFGLSFVCYLLSTGLIFLLPKQGNFETSRKNIHLTLRQISPEFWKILLIGSVVYFVITAMLRFISPFLVEIRNLSLVSVGVLSASVAAGGLLLMTIFGYYADRRGTLTSLSLAVILYSLSLGFIVWTGSGGLLLMAFLFQGAYFVARALLDAVVGKFSRENRSGLHFGIFGLATGISQGIAALAGGWLYAHKPQLAFIIIMIFGFVGAGFVWKWRKLQ